MFCIYVVDLLLLLTNGSCVVILSCYVMNYAMFSFDVMYFISI